jgi:pyridoxine 5-phosphate synthase
MSEKRNIWTVQLNMEMAATPELVEIACRVKPAWVCLVPEKRLELTTEGGLNVATMHKTLGEAIGKLTASGVRVSLFIEPSAEIAQLSK